MANNNTALNPRVFSLSSEVYLIKVIPIGSINATTVCSPINEDKTAESAVNPNTIFFVLLPVSRIIPKAIRLSQPCCTMATANINEPIIKKTASFINDREISSGPPIPNTTSITIIYSAIAGNGIGSVIIIIRAVITIIIIRYPSTVSPSGVGKINRTNPTSRAMRNHFFWVTQKRKLVNECCENPNIEVYNFILLDFEVIYFQFLLS